MQNTRKIFFYGKPRSVFIIVLLQEEVPGVTTRAGGQLLVADYLARLITVRGGVLPGEIADPAFREEKETELDELFAAIEAHLYDAYKNPPVTPEEMKGPPIYPPTEETEPDPSQQCEKPVPLKEVMDQLLSWTYALQENVNPALRAAVIDTFNNHADKIEITYSQELGDRPVDHPTNYAWVMFAFDEPVTINKLPFSSFTPGTTEADKLVAQIWCNTVFPKPNEPRFVWNVEWMVLTHFSPETTVLPLPYCFDSKRGLGTPCVTPTDGITIVQ